MKNDAVKMILKVLYLIFLYINCKVFLLCDMAAPIPAPAPVTTTTRPCHLSILSGNSFGIKVFIMLNQSLFLNMVEMLMFHHHLQRFAIMP